MASSIGRQGSEREAPVDALPVRRLARRQIGEVHITYEITHTALQIPQKRCVVFCLIRDLFCFNREMKTDTRHNSSPTTTIVSKLIYSTLFWLAHSLFTCLSLTLLFITRIGQICRTFGLWQGPSLVNHLISSTTNSSLLSSDFRLPTHIAVGVSEDEIDLSDIVNLICFCHYANIQFLSIYDQKGVCTKPNSSNK